MIIYYNKKLMKQTQTQSEDTIPMTDELMADYIHYAGNQQDKSLELIQEVGEIPYLEYYELDEDGNRYSYYLDEMVDGKYLPDLVAEQEAIDEAEALAVKQGKDEALEQLVVTTNLVPFDANAQSINYMSSVIALASAEYCLITSQGMNPAEAYSIVFKTVIPWKNADNTVSQVELETVKEALNDAMNAVGAIKTGV